MSVIRVSQNSFNAGEISPLLYTSVNQEQYKNSCMELSNMLLYPQGTAYRRSGFEFLGEVENSGRLIPFVFNSEHSYILEFTENYMRIWYRGELLLNSDGNPILVESPFPYCILDNLQYAQNAEIMYFTSAKFRMHKLERIGHRDWRIKPVLFGATIGIPTEIKSVGGKQTEEEHHVYICAVDSAGREGIASSIYTLKEKATSFLPIDFTWKEVPDAKIYHVYIRFAGEDLYSLRGHTERNSFHDIGRYFDSVQMLAKVRGPYNGEGSYPCTVQFWQQRLVVAGSLAEPQTLWFSRVGEYENLFPTEPMLDDDAITITLSSETVQPICWLYAHRAMVFIGTDLGEWSLSSGVNGAITPTAVSIRKHTAHGASVIPPVRIGDTMLFIQRDKKIVRQLQYVMENDSFIGNDLTIFAEHIVHNTKIRAWVWQQYPNTVLWVLLENGTLAGLTFVQEYGIFAWHKHYTEGKIESIASIPSTESNEIYMVIQRTINGKVRRYLERMYDADATPEIEDSKYLDASVWYEGEKREYIDGLEHLEGEEVQIIGDGMVQKSQYVINGHVTLEYPSSKICIGIGYNSHLIPIIKYIPESAGKLVDGRIYSILKARVHTLNTPVVFINNTIDSIIYPSMSNEHLDISSREYSGLSIHTTTLPSQKSRKYNIKILQNIPLPMTISAITVDILYK